jgi:hypothetical protein
MNCRVVKYMLIYVSKVCTSETSANIYFTTRHYIPEDSKLHTRSLENLKSHKYSIVCVQLTVRYTSMSYFVIGYVGLFIL